ncbi:hypothetical protein BH10ACT3_BH10ACT3_20830 [soil metagenome]
MDRVADTIALLQPIYKARDQSVPADLTPEDIVTNEFIDTNIKL